MQPEPTSPSTAPASAQRHSAIGRRRLRLGQAQPLVFLVLMFGVFYFLLIRPQQKRQREADDMLKALQKGDKVRTSGGIRGEILDLTDTEVDPADRGQGQDQRAALAHCVAHQSSVHGKPKEKA